MRNIGNAKVVSKPLSEILRSFRQSFLETSRGIDRRRTLGMLRLSASIIRDSAKFSPELIQRLPVGLIDVEHWEC